MLGWFLLYSKMDQPCIYISLICAQLCPTHCDPVECKPSRLLCPWDSPGKNTEVGCHFLLQGIFPTQDWTHVSCSSHPGREIITNATWEAPIQMSPPFWTSFSFRSPQSIKWSKMEWNWVIGFACFWTLPGWNCIAYALWSLASVTHIMFNRLFKSLAHVAAVECPLV